MQVFIKALKVIEALTGHTQSYQFRRRYDHAKPIVRY